MVVDFNPFSLFAGINLACLVVLILSAAIYFLKKPIGDLSNKIFVFLLFTVIAEVVFEFGCYVAVQSLPDNYLWWMFVLKMYVVLIFAVTVLMTLYVISIDRTISIEKRRQRIRNGGISLAVLSAVFVVFTLSTKLDVFYDGMHGYSYSPIITYFMIPVVGCMMAFWLWIAIKNLKLSRNINKRRFIPVLTFIVLYGATVIVQGLLGRWILLSTLAHTIIVVIMINTIENPETKMLGAVTTAKDKMERLSVAKDEFMSIASHQLRTPITAIEGYSDMLARGDFGKLTKEQERAIRQINESATNMSSSVKDFLNISRIQTGHFVLNKTECSVREIVEKRIAQTRAMASEKNVKIIAQYGKKLPEAVMIDEEKISQVVMNFIDNAIYYTYPKHKVVIDLVVHSKQLVFTVEDEGIGVPAKEQSKLFSKFYRASNARTTRPDGTGIGLFLAKKIITTHGGTIIFSSIEGEGSVFGFSLPLDKLK